MKSKVLTILLSAAIAFGLWLYVITVERTQIEYTFYNIPVIMDGESVLEERGLMLTSDTERTVNLTLSGNRSNLNKLKSSDITVLVDLTRIYEAGEKELSYTVSFPGDVQNSAIEIVSRQPDNIKLTVAQWASKEIPVQIAITGTPAEGYKIDEANISATPNTVDISGPKELIDQIAMGKITVDMTGAKGSYEQRHAVTLCDAQGNPVDQDLSKVFVDNHMISVKVPVLMEKDITLDFEIIPGGGLDISDVQISYALGTNKVTVEGNPLIVSKMDDVIILDRFDFNDPVEGFVDKEYRIPLPEGVTVQEGEIVEVTMTIPERETRILPVPHSQCKITGLADGYEATFVRKNIEVTLLGKKASLEKLVYSDITVELDLTGKTESGSYEVQIKVESTQKVSVVGDSYKVYVLLTPVEPEP